MDSKKGILVAIGGGSCSGKTTIADMIYQLLRKKLKVAILPQDNYYKPYKNKSMAQRKAINFDHPDAFDWKLLWSHLNNLLMGKTVAVPMYDYVNYTRKKETIEIGPLNVVILEGLMPWFDERIAKLCKLKIFVEATGEERLIRRIERDWERGRDVASIIKQWREAVSPMYEIFVEKMKQKADLIIPWSERHEVSTNVLDFAIEHLFRKHVDPN
ncbi:uridine kinase [Mycoplasmoides pneumoniae]|uniref:uridine kinase n=1 Tax=Mycoplasmoides pneumoniae TaxID=2104 RepID=UPI0027E17460|nr:uridine kinase [Mycoplasmoides pneumoniae]